MAGAWYGVLHGFDHVPRGNYEVGSEDIELCIDAAFQNVEYHAELDAVAKKLFDLRKVSSQPKAKIESEDDQRGPCVHFTFCPSEILDNMPAFRQWLLDANKGKAKHCDTRPTPSVLSKMVFQGLRID